MSAATNISQPRTLVGVGRAVESAEFRRRIGSISRQSAVYFSGTIFTAAAGFFFKIYLARALGAQALGLYTLGMSIVGFLALIVCAGLPTAATRFIAEYRGCGDDSRLKAFLRGSLTILIASSAIFGLALTWAGPRIALRFYHAPLLSSCFWLFVPILIFGVLNTFLGQAMAGYHDVQRRTLITNFLGTPVNIVFAIAFIALGFGLKGYLAAQILSSAIAFMLLGISLSNLIRREARAESSKSFRLERNVLSFSAGAFALTAVEFILAQADKIVLGHYLDAAQVGVYAVAATLVGFVPIALQSVNQIFSPTIAELHANGNRDLLQQLYSTLTKWVLILTLPLALTFMFFSRQLIAMFGPAYATGAAVLVIGAAGQLINCAVGSVGYLLLMSGNQARLVVIETCNAALVIGFSMLLIPRFGIAGSAFAAALAVAMTNLWSLAVVFRRLKLFPYHSGYWKLVPAACGSAAALFALLHAVPSSTTHWQLAPFALVCGYVSFGAIFLAIGLDEDDKTCAAIAWRRITSFYKAEGS